MTLVTNHWSESESQGFGTQVPLGSVQNSGTYICNWDGRLFRLPIGESSPGGQTPMFNLVSKEPLFLTKLSSDPFMPISEARSAASSLNVHVNF
ncbi:MAG: hypothetical protein AABZ47_02210 [Planctomycetota bacterium]